MLWFDFEYFQLQPFQSYIWHPSIMVVRKKDFGILQSIQKQMNNSLMWLEWFNFGSFGPKNDIDILTNTFRLLLSPSSSYLYFCIHHFIRYLRYCCHQSRHRVSCVKINLTSSSICLPKSANKSILNGVSLNYRNLFIIDSFIADTTWWSM